MSMNFANVLGCDVGGCAFNHEGKCRTMGINVGGPEPLCDTFTEAQKKAGIFNVTAKVGACKVQNCVNNSLMECTAPGIRVIMQESRALCGGFSAR